MPIIKTGDFDIQTNVGNVVDLAAVNRLVDGWARYAHETYAYRESLGKIRSLFHVSVVNANTIKISVTKQKTTLDMFQYKSYRNAVVNATERNLATRRDIRTSRQKRSGTVITTGRVLRASPYVKLYELNPKFTKTPVFFHAVKKQLFARNQQPTWAGGKRLSIHRVHTLPMAMYVASKRVENGFRLADKLNGMGMTIIGRT
jgi:hypothetical protein